MISMQQTLVGLNKTFMTKSHKGGALLLYRTEQ